jgi:antagonist of KipI
MALTVIRSGALTTVQDLGRRGRRAEGLPWGGAVDAWALRVANLLVGNAEDAAGLEWTLIGPELEFSEATLVALAGAPFGPHPTGQPWRVEPGERLRLDVPRWGCRGYLAVGGGIEVASILGGRGTCLTASFGGWEGRALRDGDVLPTAACGRRVVGRWHLDERVLGRAVAAPIARIVCNPEERRVGEGLCAHRFTVSPRSDRMGLRLEGPRLAAATEPERISSAVLPGSIQVPPDGRPIALLADAQTLGGYPLAGHVIGADLGILAQLRPGETIGFREVSLDEAHAAACGREASLALLRQGLGDKLTGEP